ncbi:hypothetical protein BDZ89DRAFT_1144413 [Hymenopellis radicata]|nr:hypothetical protein BDZ89DRAFT_1144413 [Hymenopellis radicata]
MSGRPINVTDEEATRLLLVLSHSLAESTLQSYATGLLVFHVFCDTRTTPEDQRAPASPDLISIWLSTIAGSYSGAAVKNYLYGVRAWHIIHGVDWHIKKPELDALVRAAEKLQPSSSKRKKREPYTIAFMEAVIAKLDATLPLDAAVIACLTTSFYSAARLGEFTVPRLEDFHPSKYVKVSDMRHARDRNGFETTVFHIPRTKAEPVNGEDVYWARQTGTTDPESTLRNHLHVNAPPNDGHPII